MRVFKAMTMSRIFSIDFTHSGMTAAFVSDGGAAEDTAGFDMSDFLAGESAAPLEKLVTLLTLKARAGGAVDAVALAMPCALDAGRARVASFHAAPWLNDQPLPALLSDALGVPVVMERRAVISLYCDRIMLGLPEDCVVVGCYVDDHMTSAIWAYGRFAGGKNGMAGDIAHMPIAGREDRCFCGKAGCVDLYGSGARLAHMHSMIFPDMPREELFEREGGHPIVLDYIATMAHPLAMEANILDPDFMILGGCIPSMRGFPRAVLEEQICRQWYRAQGNEPPVFLSSAASVAPGVVCAAQYALSTL